MGGKTPEAFLKWSMDQYAAMPSFQAKATLATKANGEASPGEQHRELFIQGGNRFKIVALAPNGFQQTAVSDGKNLVEYASAGSDHATRYPSPSKIGDAMTVTMRHPMFCGSLLYQFFGGAGNYGQLVDEAKGAPQFGPDETAPGGEAACVVRFYGQQKYGNVQALIGKTTGKVYRLVYDSAPLLEQMHKVMDAEIAQLPAGKDRDEAMKQQGKFPKSFVTTETYSEIKSGATLVAATFDTAPPKGMPVQDAATGPNDAPPVPIGKPAPNFELTGLDGKKVSLSSLRGKVVMIDFWATWCGPCREALPDTEKIAKASVGKNVQVMAVSDETRETVAAFMKQNNYTMPNFLDQDGSVHRSYKASAIPCMAIIDANGNLAAYHVGGRPEEEIRSELAKAGAVL
ncbi:redoxin domain-containing protein [Fimbriimonas ginsengisoli Gsoil 348]|uniref:Redoxin domain-containing protein n=1 Tax=Fimbriimonas ginsengisoli Gsoil 348 TaxID=661478 RepID=A0A068NRE0_FIMGI|nr:redoxin domain-containing protein [Fimbriimonas ginsengisoli Gsoil 348]